MTLTRCLAIFFWVVAFDLQAQVIECTQPLFSSPPSMDAFTRWEADRNYSIQARKNGSTGEYSIVVAGDTLWLSEKDLPSLKREPNSPHKDLYSITFDARIIVLDMALEFESANVIFKAETLRFTSRGKIVLSTPPKQGGDKVVIVTDSLDLTHAPNVPFVFVTNNWKYVTDATEKPWPSDKQRSLSISANKADFADPGEFTEVGALSYFRARTLDKGFPKDGPNSEKPFSIEISSASAASGYVSSLENAQWPVELAAKTGRYFSRAPFDEPSNTFLKISIIDRYSGLLPPQQQSAKMSLLRIRDSIERRVDSFGFSAYFVPRQTFVARLESFEKSLDSKVEIMKDWEPAIVSIHNGVQPDAQKLTKARTDLEAKRKTLEADSKKLDTLLTELGGHEQAVSGLLNQLESRRVILASELEQLILQDQQNAKYKQMVKVASTIASLIPASAPVGIAVGTAISVGGELVFAYRDGKPFDVGTLTDVINNGTQFGAKVSAFRNGWDKVKETRVKALDTSLPEEEKKKSREQFVDAAKGLASAADELFKHIKPAAVSELSLTEFEKKDSQLNNLLKQLEARRDLEKVVLAGIIEKRQAVQLLQAQALEIEAALSSLLTVSLSNDFAIARQRQTALLLREDVISSLARESSLLKRAFAYEAGTAPTVEESIQFFAESFRLMAGSAIEGTSLGALGDADKLSKSLEEQRELTRKNYKVLIAGLRADYDAHLESLAQPLSLSPIPFEVSSAQPGPGSDFLNAVNAAMRLTAEGKSPSPIALPFKPEPSSDFKLQRLLHVAVKEVQFANGTSLQGKYMSIAIAHPGFGLVHQQQGCFGADFRNADWSSNKIAYTTTIDSSGILTVDDVLQKYPVSDRRSYARYPFDTAYFAELDVKNSSGGPVDAATIPQLTGIKLIFYRVD